MNKRPTKRRAAVKKARRADADISYGRHKSEISIVMSRFCCRYLKDIYREFNGDITLPIVLGEIALHNVARYVPKSEALADMEEEIWAVPTTWKAMDSCNAYSLSQAIGIPRETVRRKLSWLVKKGWLEREREGGYRITPRVSQHFINDFNVDLMNSLLNAGDIVRKLLSR